MPALSGCSSASGRPNPPNLAWTTCHRGSDVRHDADPPDGRPAPGSRATPRSLTPREWEVAEFVGLGMSSEETASKLVVAQRTAEGHIERVPGRTGLPVPRPTRRLGTDAAERPPLDSTP
ncbi:LuxR C-terminal-related transcriptional regulator [Stenotrophomonas sp. NPDC087984]